jgi:hypothetical protein
MMAKEGFLKARDHYLHPRRLYGTPNETLQLVGTLIPELYDDERASACRPTPINFSGSLFAAMQKEELVRHLSASGYNIPNELQNPYEILHDIPLFMFDRITKRYSTLDLKAPTVLAKYACGKKDMALVLEGDLTGAVIRKRLDVATPQQGMFVSRLINDEGLTPAAYPYEPNFYFFNTEILLPLPLKTDQSEQKKCWEFLGQASRYFFSLYEDFLRHLGATPETPLQAIDILFYQMKQLHIPFDENNFHFTRPDCLKVKPYR